MSICVFKENNHVPEETRCPKRKMYVCVCVCVCPTNYFCNAISCQLIRAEKTKQTISSVIQTRVAPFFAQYYGDRCSSTKILSINPTVRDSQFVSPASSNRRICPTVERVEVAAKGVREMEENREEDDFRDGFRWAGSGTSSEPRNENFIDASNRPVKSPDIT